jgi:hypothetical protein
MTNSKFKPTTPTLTGPKISAEVRAILGKPPVLISEDPSVYDTMLANMAAAVMPRDAIEWILMKDCVDLTWEIRRIRLAKAGITDVTRKEALKSILESILNNSDLKGRDPIAAAQIMADDWYNDPSAKEALLAHLAKHGLDEEAITAQAFALRSRELEKLDHMLASAERRRFAMLQEMGLYRDLFIMRVRDGISIVDEQIDQLTLQPPKPQAIEPKAIDELSEHQP